MSTVPDPVWAAALIVAAYLCGSIPVGYLIGRARGVDVRTQGSGNIGATNVARTVGKRVGALVLLLDALKGATPLSLYYVLALDHHIVLAPSVDAYLLTAVGLAPILGHCFPIWLRFRGGKGVATALGVFLVMDPAVIGIAIGVFALIYASFRIVSVASMSAALSVPLLGYFMGRPLAIIALGALGSLLIVVKHRQNIRRLLQKSELKV